METLSELISLSFLFCLFVSGYTDGCKCHMEKIMKQNERNSSWMGKRQLPDVEDDSEDGYNLDMSVMVPEYASSTLAPRKDLRRMKTHGLNETHLEENEPELKTNYELKQVCPYYQQAPELSLHKMTGVWGLTYYKATDEMSCFKMRIDVVDVQKRKDYSTKYSTFNDTIDWPQCHLQVTKINRMPKSNDLKHFLMGPAINEHAILENIVLSETVQNDTKTITLQEESPDQWMTYRNLLLMRDCDLGSVLVFGHGTTHVNAKDAENALRIFGEDNVIDMNSCLRETVKRKRDTKPPFRYIKHNILS